MAYTTHEKIRVESGFQSRFVREAFKNSPDGIATTFYVQSDDNVKFVPEFNTGNTIAGISDVQVWFGLSGVYGVSRLGVSAIDIDQGSIQLSIIPSNGGSLIVNYSSSAVTSQDVENVRAQAEGIIGQRLALCYASPATISSPNITSLASRLGSALLLIRNYGSGARTDMAADGYRLYGILMGNNQMNQAKADLVGAGEIGMICTPNWQTLDYSGAIIPRNDLGAQGNDTFIIGGRTRGNLFDITEEGFRKLPDQKDVNQDQAGSGVYPNSNTGSPWS